MQHEIYTPYGNCVWRRSEPTALKFIIYAFIVPALACFGFCANFINTIVFMRPKMTPSAFSYLAAVSCLDCISCLFITLTALSRSIFYNSYFWIVYDFQWQTPLFGITTGAGNLILACLSCDRMVYLWNGLPNGTPRFCRRRVARRMVIVALIISFAVNIPYFFVFIVNEDGTFQTTSFYYSEFYKIHNWFTFILLGILPAVFLLIGNAVIVIAFRRWNKKSKLCQNANGRSSKCTQKRYKHQTRLTISIVIVITLYLVGEIPAHMTSRKSALNLLFGGDITKVNLKVMENMEVICLTLNALQLSMNIIVYAVINPSFMPEFFACLRSTSDVCCDIFCFTGIIKYCYKRYQRNKPKTLRSTQRTKASPVTNCNEIENNTGHIPPTEENNESGLGIMSNDETSLRRVSSWKRSSSLGNLAYDNYGLEIELPTEEEHNKSKRHSIAL
ncbi:uncharacterized protein LOC119674449 [Teleopsis dalmanni]|uniref:uncharacterized protein LOC119674449 n=1 Tax=Teleopsis dalmanni TaxID=139649 RepID=UPI0018CF1A8D|nr:uncharacterized protein LOC119674449 [Teleopsis dalmanni]